MLFADRQARRGAHAPLGQRQERQGISRDDGQQAHRRHLQRRRRGGRTAGRTRCRARPRSASGSLDGIANGLRPWFTKFAGTHPRPALAEASSRTSTAGITSVENYLRNERPLARVGLVYSQQTAWFYRGPQAGRRSKTTRSAGTRRSIEARIPFEMVHDRLLDAEHRRAVQDPRSCPTSPPCPTRSAGSSARSSSAAAASSPPTRPRSTTSGACRRKDFGLADLFGVSFRGGLEGPMQNSYLRLEDDPQRSAAPAARRPGGRAADHQRRLPAGRGGAPRRSATRR